MVHIFVAKVWGLGRWVLGLRLIVLWLSPSILHKYG